MAEGQHGGMAVGLNSSQGPPVLCLWQSVLGAAEVLGLLAFWGQGPRSQEHCCHGPSSSAGPKDLV